MAAQYAEAPMTIRAEATLRDALRKLAEQDQTNVSEYLRRELRALVARKGMSLQAANDAPGSEGQRQ